jgi:uncharacterized protein
VVYLKNKASRMRRDLLKKLEQWKQSKNRKPLIIQGARQVGKTWIMKAFGKQFYTNVVYLNFESSSRLRELFLADFNIERIITTLEIETNQKIEASNSLIIFDEIQEATKGLTALKYFYENAPQYHIIAAGSLLGVSIQKKNSFPIGKVDFLHLYPLDFLEFLNNIGEEKLEKEIKETNWEILSIFHEKIINLLRVYYFVGGMPEVVKNYIENKDLNHVREIQSQILFGYQNDFAKHAPNEILPKIHIVWDALLSQLAKENRKFIYGHLKKGARAKDFEDAINWLSDAGLVHKINRIKNPSVPLQGYVDQDAFKLYFLDIGLLNAMGKLPQSILLEKNQILKEFKGALTEQFVCAELIQKHNLYYWNAENATAEIDFILQLDASIIPIEVKAEENLKAKSLKVYFEKFNPDAVIRSSMHNHRKEKWLENIPLYALSSFFKKEN